MFNDPKDRIIPLRVSDLAAALRDWMNQVVSMASSAWPSHVVQQFDYGKFGLTQMVEAEEQIALRALQTNKGPVANLIRQQAKVRNAEYRYTELLNHNAGVGTIADPEPMIAALAPYSQMFNHKRAFWIIGKYFEIDDWSWKARHHQQSFEEVQLDGVSLKKNASGSWAVEFVHTQKNGCVTIYEITPRSMSFHVKNVSNALEEVDHPGTLDNIDLDWVCDKLREVMIAAGWSEQVYQDRLMNKQQFAEALSALRQEQPIPEGMPSWAWEYSTSPYRSYSTPKYQENLVNRDGVQKLEWQLHTQDASDPEAIHNSSNVFRINGVDLEVVTMGDGSRPDPADEKMHEMSYRFIYEQIKKYRGKAIEKYIEDQQVAARNQKGESE